MISASHNPYSDNGIKLFGPDGYKLDDDTERAIEALMGEKKTALLALSRWHRTREADRQCPGALHRIRQTDAAAKHSFR